MTPLISGPDPDRFTIGPARLLDQGLLGSLASDCQLASGIKVLTA